jgi:ribose-phosphate pyrophosphokinase
MISHGKNVKVFSANAIPKLAQDIANIIGVPLGNSRFKRC